MACLVEALVISEPCRSWYEVRLGCQLDGDMCSWLSPLTSRTSCQGVVPQYSGPLCQQISIETDILPSSVGCSPAKMSFRLAHGLFDNL